MDPRLRQAAAHAEGGRVTQYLAGAPELEQRYRTAPPAVRAIIQVAMDARRLGHPTALPHALLEQVAPSYLDDHDWDPLGEDWLEQAFAYGAQPCKGARGPLTRIRPRPGSPTIEVGSPQYRLADYLDQLGRHELSAVYPPEHLWKAFTVTVTDPALLNNLGNRAEERGRYQHAIWMYNQAAHRGDTDALVYLARTRERSGDRAGAEALAIQAADRGDTNALVSLARMLEQSGDAAGAEAMAVQAANRGDTNALRALAALRRRPEAIVRADALAMQAARRRTTDALQASVLERARLWERWAEVRAYSEALDTQATKRVGAVALAFLAGRREQAGDSAGAEAMYKQAADRGDTIALRALVALRERAGDSAGAEALAAQAAERGDTVALELLVALRERAGNSAGAEALATHAANRGDTSVLAVLAEVRERAGDRPGAEALIAQTVDRGYPFALESLAWLRERAGDALSAGRIRRFGLTGSGDVATELEFGS